MEEKTLYAVTVKKPKSFGRWDTYALVITDARIIVAQLTAEMLKEAAAQANKAGKAEGKGFFQRWGAQLKATTDYSEKYLGMRPEKILQENKGNFAVQNTDVTAIKLDRKWTSGSGAVKRVSGAELEVISRGRTLGFETDALAETLAASLQLVFGTRVTVG